MNVPGDSLALRSKPWSALPALTGTFHSPLPEGKRRLGDVGAAFSLPPAATVATGVGRPLVVDHRQQWTNPRRLALRARHGNHCTSRATRRSVDRVNFVLRLVAEFTVSLHAHPLTCRPRDILYTRLTHAGTNVITCDPWIAWNCCGALAGSSSSPRSGLPRRIRQIIARVRHWRFLTRPALAMIRLDDRGNMACF